MHYIVCHDEIRDDSTLRESRQTKRFQTSRVRRKRDRVSGAGKTAVVENACEYALNAFNFLTILMSIRLPELRSEFKMGENIRFVAADQNCRVAKGDCLEENMHCPESLFNTIIYTSTAAKGGNHLYTQIALLVNYCKHAAV